MNRTLAALAFAAILILLVQIPGGSATKTKKSAKKTAKRKSAPAQPATSPADREAALASVSEKTIRTDGPSKSTLDNPAALVPFFERLAALNPNESVHILHYGDSHTAADDWPNVIRQSLQARFGTGGAGFVFAGHPYPGFRRFDIAGNGSAGWRTAGVLTHPGDNRNGLGGLSIETALPGQTVTLTTDLPDLKLLYLRQPNGGSLQLFEDAQPLAVIRTQGDPGPGYYERPTPANPGPHAYTLKTLDPAPVRLFGWVAGRNGGVTYESMGINGAQIATFLAWDEPIFAEHLARRDPALILLAYGTNESLNPGWTRESYAAQFAQAIERFRRASPTTSIVVIGPPDCQFLRQGRYTTAQLDGVVAVQHEVAVRYACSFWDWRARMGGPGAIAEWIRAGLAQPDRIHLTPSGYHRIGELLTEDLMEQYRRFEAAKAE